MKIKFVISTLFFLSTFISNAATIDSLRTILKTEQDIDKKIEIWIELSRTLAFSSNHAEGKSYLDKAIKLADKHNKVDLSLKAKLVSVNYEIIHGDLDKAFLLALENQKAVESKKDIQNKRYCYESLGNIYHYKGNSKKAIEYFLKALDNTTEEEELVRAKIMRALALNHTTLLDFKRSYQYLFKALTIFKKTNNSRELANCYNLLATLYIHQENWEKAATYYTKSYDLIAATKDTLNTIISSQNLALIHLKQQAFRKAIQRYEKNVILAKAINYPPKVIENRILVASCHNDLKDYNKALNILESLQDSIHLLGIHQTTTYHQAIAETYFGLKNYSKSLSFAELFYESSAEADYPISIKTSLELLQRVHSKLGNFKQAYDYHVQYKTISDTLLQQANIEQLTTQKLQFEFEEQQQSSEKEKMMLEEKLKRQKIVRGFIILIAGLLALASFLIYRYYKKQNALLAKDLDNKQVIEQQAEELQTLYDSKSRFFDNIAHELRTPLTLISGPIHAIVQQGELSSKHQQQLNIVQRNINYLKSLVNQILDLSKADKKELNLEISQFELNDLILALSNDFLAFAQYQNVDFQTPMYDNNKIMLVTDGEKLYTVVKNILANAFKFTTVDNGKIIFNYVDLGKDIQITIQDNGSGISKNDLPNIFNRYYQSLTNESESGTGIGLAICKEYIELLQGDIKVNSEVGKGTLFVINFPKCLSNDFIQNERRLSFLKPTNHQPISLNTSIIDNDNPSILIVEDNFEVCEYLKSILETNYQITFAHNGIEALEQLETIQPNLIVTDVMMPKMNGFELVKTLKQSPKFQNIPIIVLTALGETTDKLQGFRIGIDDYIVKPFHQEQLQLRITYLLKNQQNRIEFTEELVEELVEENANTDTEPLMSENKPIDENIIWLEEVEHLVRKNMGNIDFNVYQLSLNLSMSRSHFYRRLKAVTGLTPKRYIDQIRYHEARNLLEKNPNIVIKRLAYKVGFKDEKNFARNFKKLYGKYPSEYVK